MEISAVINQLKEVQAKTLNYITNQDGCLDDYLSFMNDIFQNEKYYKMNDYLQLIFHISNSHRRSPFFFERIEQIIRYFKDAIIHTFSNLEIYNLFKCNKRLLLFLIEEKVITVDDTIAYELSQESDNYYYFHLEIHSFYDQENKEKYQVNNYLDFEWKRKRGENDNFLCQLIQNDSIQEFVSFVNRKNLSLSTTIIEKSVFEANSFLLNKKPTLIEYAAFFGSLQIVKFLFLNNVELTPSLWLYAIHSNNADLIHFLEANKIKPENDSFEECLKEAIICHHNNIAIYIQNNYFDKIEDVIEIIIQSHNYNFMEIDLNKSNVIYALIKNNYSLIVSFLANKPDFDINAQIKYYINIIFFALI